MSEIQIRQISEADVEGFHRCLDTVARARTFLGLVEAPPLDQTRKWLIAGMERNEIRLVAVEDAQIVGWSDIEVNHREGFRHSGQLGMGLLPEFRGQGFGTKLIEEALSLAKARHLERVELEVYASNLPAIRLYEKFNFQIEGRKRQARKLDGAYEDIIFMSLILEQ